MLEARQTSSLVMHAQLQTHASGPFVASLLPSPTDASDQDFLAHPSTDKSLLFLLSGYFLLCP